MNMLDFGDETISENLAKIINQIYLRVKLNDKEKRKENWKELLSKKFCLDKGFTYEVIESCYWLIEDSELAISDFYKYGLQGLTRIENNRGERYLRLYGILNSVNLQKSVIIQLYEIFKLQNKKLVIAKFKDLEIIRLRNKLGAHTVDYSNNGERDYFRISRRTLDTDGRGIQIVSKDGFEEHNLKELLDKFKIEFNKELLLICKTLVNKFFVKESKNYKQLNRMLDIIEDRINDIIILGKSGGLIFKMQVGNKNTE